MSSFVLILRNKNKEKLIKDKSRDKSWSFQDSLCLARLSPFQLNQISQVLKMHYFGHNDMPVCMSTVHLKALHKGFYCNFHS